MQNFTHSCAAMVMKAIAFPNTFCLHQANGYSFVSMLFDDCKCKNNDPTSWEKPCKFYKDSNELLLSLFFSPSFEMSLHSNLSKAVRQHVSIASKCKYLPSSQIAKACNMS